MTTANDVRSYLEARIEALNAAIAPLMEEKHALQRVLFYLPSAPPLREALQALAQQDPTLREHLQPLLKKEPEVPATTPMISFLTPYRRKLLEAMPEDFTRQNVFDWVREHSDDYSTDPGARTSRAREALRSFKSYHLVRDFQGGYTKRPKS